MVQFTVLLVLTIVSAYASGRVAEHRGRSGRGWTCASANLGPIALLAVALLPPRRKSDRV